MNQPEELVISETLQTSLPVSEFPVPRKLYELLREDMEITGMRNDGLVRYQLSLLTQS